jgi:hypothetical protein
VNENSPSPYPTFQSAYGMSQAPAAMPAPTQGAGALSAASMSQPMGSAGTFDSNVGGIGSMGAAPMMGGGQQDMGQSTQWGGQMDVWKQMQGLAGQNTMPAAPQKKSGKK